MGGYGGSRTVSGILPVDEYYKDASVSDLLHDDSVSLIDQSKSRRSFFPPA
jgi:hypothetical protein